MDKFNELRMKRAENMDSLQAIADLAEKRALSDAEREKVKQIRDSIQLIDVELETLEASSARALRAHNPATKEARALQEAVNESRTAGGKQKVKYNPEAFFRAMTPEAGSAGKSKYTGTDSVQLTTTEDLSWLDLLSITQVERNGQVVPFVSRSNRLTPQTKGYTDALSGQAYTISAYTVDFSNYYTYLEVHNDVLRDAADASIQQVLFNASRTDIIRQIAKDVLTGATGGDNLVGISATSGVQTVAGGSAAISDYTLITEAVQKLMSNGEVNPANIAVIMHPAIWQQFADLTSAGDGQPLQRPDAIKNVPFYAYSGIPVNQGTGSDETTIFVGDLSKWTLYTDGFYEVASQSGPNMARDYTDVVITYRADVATIDPASMCLIQAVTV